MKKLKLVAVLVGAWSVIGVIVTLVFLLADVLSFRHPDWYCTDAMRIFAVVIGLASVATVSFFVCEGIDG
jgi:presenilin-like A22 family membrane protease